MYNGYCLPTKSTYLSSPQRSPVTTRVEMYGWTNEHEKNNKQTQPLLELTPQGGATQNSECALHRYQIINSL